MTREEARAHFKEKGLTYADILLQDLHDLRQRIVQKMDLHRRETLAQHGENWLYWRTVNRAKYYKGDFNPFTGSMVCAFMTGCGEYFTAREVISFNRDGFIGFCGDASDRNAQPILEAFVGWCDHIAERKQEQEAEA